MGGPVAAGRLLGMKPEGFYQWRRVPRRWVAEVSALTGIPVDQLPTRATHPNRKD